MMFHERYADVLVKLCGDIDCKYNDALLNVMASFKEPIELHPDRFDYGIVVSTDAFNEAIDEFNKEMHTDYHYGRRHNVFYPEEIDDNSLNNLPIYYIFTIIELQYQELSEYHANDFAIEINQTFTENNLPWIFADGKIIKIDSCQFEMDLKNKALSLMKELKDAEPVFQSAYTELTDAAEALEKNDFQSAINNAEKSYESVLKVIVSNDNGNAEMLINQYMNYLTVPDTMTKEGFKGNVMKSLPFIRNNSGADHGAGSKTVVISKPMAKLAVNLACALDTYLIEEYKENYGESK